MEAAIFKLVAEQSWPAFRIEELTVVRREHTGVGRYTCVEDGMNQVIADGAYGAGTHFIEMEGVPNGLFFVV